MTTIKEALEQLKKLSEELKEIQVRDNENIEKDAEECPLPLEVIPNEMGINLSNVEKVKWEEQEDGQLKKVEIEFNPAEELDESNLEEDQIEEKVEKHDTLNPKLFDGTKLKPEIKDAVKKIANKYMETLEEYEIPFNLKDIILVGSNVSYNYNDKSDLDVHLIADMSGIKDSKAQEAAYGACAGLFNKNYTITFYDIPVEIYVEIKDNPVKINGIYSVLQDRWIREPVQQEIPDLDEEAFNKMLDEWKARCEQVLGIASSTEEKERDLIEN